MKSELHICYSATSNLRCDICGETRIQVIDKPFIEKYGKKKADQLKKKFAFKRRYAKSDKNPTCVLKYRNEVPKWAEGLNGYDIIHKRIKIINQIYEDM